MGINGTKIIVLLAGWLFTTAAGAQQFRWIGSPSPQQWTINPSNRAVLDAPTPARADPLFGLEVGTIWLSRSEPAAQDLVLDETGDVLLNARELSSDLTGGFRLSLDFFNLTDSVPGLDVQVRYFGVTEMSSSSTFTSTEVVPIFYGGVPATPISTVTSEYDSSLRSVEYGLCYRSPFLPGIRWTTGLRYLELDERFDFDTTDGGGVTTGFFSRTDNEMVGWQFGGEWTIWTNTRSRIFTSGKYALLYNRIDGQGEAANPAGGLLVRNFDDSSTSGLCDFEVGGSLAVTSWLGIRFSYQGLFGNNFAIAPDQSDAFSLFAAGGSVAYSDPQWHGFNLSAALVW